MNVWGTGAAGLPGPAAPEGVANGPGPAILEVYQPESAEEIQPVKTTVKNHGVTNNHGILKMLCTK